MILESERRWPDWQGGQPIELPDGQTWHFHEPAPLVRDGIPGWTFGADTPEQDAVLSARFGLVVARWGQATNDGDRAASILDAAWFLLARNYAVTRAEFGAILLKAALWDRERHERFAGQILALIGEACTRSTALAEVA